MYSNKFQVGIDKVQYFALFTIYVSSLRTISDFNQVIAWHKFDTISSRSLVSLLSSVSGLGNFFPNLYKLIMISIYLNYVLMITLFYLKYYILTTIMSRLLYPLVSHLDSQSTSMHPTKISCCHMFYMIILTYELSCTIE